MTAIKCLALLVVLLAAMAGAAIGVCKGMKTPPHGQEMIEACSLALVAAIIAVIPAMLQKGHLDTAGMFQAALIGSVLHLGIILLTAIVMLMLKRVTTPFVLWLLGGYWATLIGLIVTFAKLIQTAPKPAKTGL